MRQLNDPIGVSPITSEIMKGMTNVGPTLAEPLARGKPSKKSKVSTTSSAISSVADQVSDMMPTLVAQSSKASSSSKTADSKRCRFASKGSSSGGLPKETTIESQHNLVNGQGLDVMAAQCGTHDHHQLMERHAKTSGDLQVNAPGAHTLGFDHAEYILSLVVQGKPTPSNFEIDIEPQKNPKGGKVFLVPKSLANFDHYDWKEVRCELGVTAQNGMGMDYRLFHINLDPSISSSIFKREIFDMGNNSLVYYSGDDRIIGAKQGMGIPTSQGQRQDKSQGSQHKLKKNGVALYEPHQVDPSGDMQLRSSQNDSDFNSWPRNRKTIATVASGSEMDFPLRVSSASLRPSPFDSFSLWPSESDPIGNASHHFKPPANLAPSTIDCFQELMQVADELACGKVVKNMTVFPSLQLTLLHPDMTKEFEKCCRLVCSDSDLTRDRLSGNPGGIKLFYDTTFSLGKVYVTLLTFVNCCYDGDPVMPLAVNIHEAKFKSSHQLFWARIVGDLPILQKYRFPLLIDDAEPAVHLAVRTQAPNLVQLEAWTHRFRDIDNYLRERGYGTEAIHYYKTCVNYLLRSKSKQAMHDRFRKEFEGVWPKDFVFYYRQKLLPRSGRLGQWALTKMRITDEDFLTPYTNPQESFHTLCNHFSNWNRLTIDQIVRAFYFLFLYFVSETGDGQQDNGIFQVKRMYNTPIPELRGKPKKGLVPHPSRIAEFIERNFPARRGRVSPGRPSSASWLAAYDATELYATTRMKSDLRDTRTQMENSCDMYDATLGSFLDEDLGLDMTDLRSSLLHPSFSTRDSVPSPAPNGRAPSPAPLDGSNNYNHLSTIPEAPSEQSLWRSSSDLVDGHLTRASSVMNDVFPDDNHFPSLSLQPPAASSSSSMVANAPVTSGAMYGTVPMTSNFQPISSQDGQTDQDYLVPTSTKDANSHRQGPDKPPQQHQYHHHNVTTINSSTNMGPQTSGSSLQNPITASAGNTMSTTTTSSHASQVVPSSLMLWKKVQHCVVFGGSFVTANKENTAQKHNDSMPQKS